MDPIDGFYQALDSERLLNEHGPSLVAEARQILATEPAAKVAGMITMPDSGDAMEIRALLTKFAGHPLPAGLLVGIVPRPFVEPLLRKRTGTEHWLEQGWQRQRILPVVVSTRDGHRFGFFSIATGQTEL